MADLAGGPSHAAPGPSPGTHAAPSGKLPSAQAEHRPSYSSDQGLRKPQAVHRGGHPRHAAPPSTTRPAGAVTVTHAALARGCGANVTSQHLAHVWIAGGASPRARGTGAAPVLAIAVRCRAAHGTQALAAGTITAPGTLCACGGCQWQHTRACCLHVACRAHGELEAGVALHVLGGKIQGEGGLQGEIVHGKCVAIELARQRGKQGARGADVFVDAQLEKGGGPGCGSSERRGITSHHGSVTQARRPPQATT
jgi:hypothetical protein